MRWESSMFDFFYSYFRIFTIYTRQNFTLSQQYWAKGALRDCSHTVLWFFRLVILATLAILLQSFYSLFDKLLVELSHCHRWLIGFDGFSGFSFGLALEKFDSCTLFSVDMHAKSTKHQWYFLNIGVLGILLRFLYTFIGNRKQIVLIAECYVSV